MVTGTARAAAAAGLRSGRRAARGRLGARRSGPGSTANPAGYCSWSRSRVSDFASSRDTCIWEMPDPFGDLGLRQRFEEPEQQHSALPLGERCEQRAAALPGSRSDPGWCRRRPGCRRSPARRRRRCRHRCRWTGCCRSCRRPGLRRPLRGPCPSSSASSVAVGARPSRWDNSEVAAPSRRCSSLSRRGTFTDQLLSRKCRRTSPMIVGTANDTKSEPVSTSNRMTALTSPTRATWTRSSRGSPRPSKRRAMWSASGRHRSTIRSRWRWNSAESVR